MSYYFQTAEKGQMDIVGFDHIDSEQLSDLRKQIAEAGISPVISTDHVEVYEMGDMVAAIVKADVFTQAASKAREAGLAFKN